MKTDLVIDGKASKSEGVAAVRVERIVSLRREWKWRENDLLNGKNWTVNDKACREARANKAEGIHECIVGINWLLSQKSRLTMRSTMGTVERIK